MATISELLTVQSLTLQLASKNVRATPTEVLRAAEEDCLRYLKVAAVDAGLDASALTFTNETARILNEQLASWANAIDVERKYGLSSADGTVGWLALAWGILDIVRSDAGTVPLSWT
ncbi:hypothetical protein [Clavibacter michiganensis]|uniref:hypothetical protein n=1 Tax=Clavibacter michiganensis TaxID=28447 RepID=UPI0011805A3E|nr:hypothetical protein [Clavibacter michiganensis]MDO4030880.1 hypothetical protein [Clavibacter michiganensis]MDO4080288.1 hypothetical protein [Clavibacter michiganensis]MDO4087658.1 hypothetical protein [Clavibacter michiganensis]MDO4095716.1 hypothetical protein [Clavibacter michiganensis]QIT12710.1 hypothetical protein GRD74_15115 [Clavibacter michiganensis subsp. michiganensis]